LLVSPLPSLACVRHHTQSHHRHPHPYRFIASPSLSCRCLWLVSWWGWVLPSLLVAECIIIKQHGLPPPLSSSLVLPFGTPGHTPAQPPFCGLACGKRGFRPDKAVMGLHSCTPRNRPQTLAHAPSPSLPPHNNMPCCLPCCFAATHDHQRDSMLCSLATKAGAMAGRRGALSGPGKVVCCNAFWEGGLVGGGGEGQCRCTRPRTARGMLIHFRLPVCPV